MRRNLLGLIALGMFGFAAAVCLYPPLADYRPAGEMTLRVGLMCGVFWLAWPDLHRLPQWVLYVLPIGLFIVVYARGVLLYLFPVLATATMAYLLYRKLRRS